MIEVLKHVFIAALVMVSMGIAGALIDHYFINKKGK